METELQKIIRLEKLFKNVELKDESKRTEIETIVKDLKKSIEGIEKILDESDANDMKLHLKAVKPKLLPQIKKAVENLQQKIK